MTCRGLAAAALTGRGHATSRTTLPVLTTTTAFCRNTRANRSTIATGASTSRCASAQRRQRPAAGTMGHRRSRATSARCIRAFHPAGIRRDRGFQAVTNTPDNPEHRRPTRASTPPAV